MNKSEEREVKQLLAHGRRLEAEDLLRRTARGSRRELKLHLDKLMGRPMAFR